MKALLNLSFAEEDFQLESEFTTNPEMLPSHRKRCNYLNFDIFIIL